MGQDSRTMEPNSFKEESAFTNKTMRTLYSFRLSLCDTSVPELLFTQKSVLNVSLLLKINDKINFKNRK